MTIRRATLDDVRHVALNMRDLDCEEFCAVSHAVDRQELADLLGVRYRDDPTVFVALAADEPVAVGGVFFMRPGVATLHMCATDSFARVVLPLTRWTRRELFRGIWRSGAHRIECLAMARNAAARAWVEVLGLRREATLQAYGAGRQDFIVYGLVRPEEGAPELA